MQAILQDVCVALEYMTDDALPAEEMRQQMLAFEGVADVRIVDHPGWVELQSGPPLQIARTSQGV